MNQVRYRTETFSGSQTRDAAEVMAYETFELGNTDILEHLSKTLLQNQCIIDRASAFIEELYANDYVEDMGSDEKVAFFREVLLEIEKNTGVSVKYALWLADLDAVMDSDLYGRDMESKEEFDSYEVGPIVLIDLGYDGALYGYTEKPICLVERIEILRDELMNIVDERENKSISPIRAQWLDERYLEVDAEIQAINDILLKKHIGDSEKVVNQNPAFDSVVHTATQKSVSQSAAMQTEHKKKQPLEEQIQSTSTHTMDPDPVSDEKSKEPALGCSNMELVRDNVKVEWEAIGEGICGDYNPDNPEDIELLRFSVSVLRDGVWEEKEDASYCTNFPVSATDEEKLAGLEILLDRFHDALSDDIDVSVKKLGEKLSWIGLDSARDRISKPSLSDQIQSASARTAESDSALSVKEMNHEPHR